MVDSPLAPLHARFFERLRIDGALVDADVTGRLLSAKMVRAYDSATSLELVLDDGDFRILRSGLVSRRGKVRQEQFDQAAWARFGEARLLLDGIAFRLAGVAGSVSGDQGHQLTLTFEDELAVLMRRKKGPTRFERGDQPGLGKDTRATVLYTMVQAATGRARQVFRTPGLLDRVPVKGETTEEKRKARRKGLAHVRRLTVKGQRMLPEQQRHIEIALQVADEEKAGDQATIAMLCAGIGESGWRDIMNGNFVPVERWKRTHASGTSGYGGVLQGRVGTSYTPNWFAPMTPDERTRQEATSFLRGGRGYQGGGAIALTRKHSDWGPGLIAVTVEGSRSNFASDVAAEAHYGQWEREAQEILDAWGGAGEIRLVHHKYFFKVAKGETFFDAAGRMAAEVRWRFWIDQNLVWYVSDEFAFKSATTLEVSPTTDGVRGFDYRSDVGIPVGELTVTANIPRWIGEPAWRTEVDGMGPLNGLWLLARHEQDLVTEDSTLTLHRPAPEIKEPAPPTTRTVQTPSTPGGADRFLRWARAAVGAREGSSRQIRWARALDLSPSLPWCSIFLAYGISHYTNLSLPGNPAYSGAWLNWSDGRRVSVSHIAPGDFVVFDWGDGGITDHVAVFVGGGDIIGGNQSDMVSRVPLDAYHRSHIVGVVRPNY